MKKMRITALILAACMLLALLAGCSKQENSADTQDEVMLPMTEEQEPVVDGPEIPDDDEGPVTVTDMSGREITLEQPADRIVALAAADCEILYAIGAGDRLVGRGEYCDYPAEVADVTSVQSGDATNYEQILELGCCFFYFNKLCHHVLIYMKTSCSIDDHNIKIIFSGMFYCSFRYIGRLIFISHRENLNTLLFSVYL